MREGRDHLLTSLLVDEGESRDLLSQFPDHVAGAHGLGRGVRLGQQNVDGAEIPDLVDSIPKGRLAESPVATETLLVVETLCIQLSGPRLIDDNRRCDAFADTHLDLEPEVPREANVGDDQVTRLLLISRSI